MPYQRRSPDYASFVADIAQRFPAEWAAARERPDGSRDEAFIRRLAWELHKVDPNVGLNGKRGSDVLSTDALSYINPTGPGGVEVIDVIVGATHSPTWQDATIPPSAQNPDGVAGKYIAPSDPGGGTSAPGPGGVTTPGTVTFTVSADLNSALAPLREELRTLRAQVEAQKREIAELKARPQTPPEPQQPATMKVALKSAHGKYVTAENDGRMTNRETQPAAWQIFELQPIRS